MHFSYRLGFILLNLISLHSFGQSGKDYGLWGRTEPDKQYVLSDTLIVRQAPDAGSLRLDTLFAGDLVEVIRKEEKDLLLKGILAPWFQVNYGKAGIKKQGYVWSGNLAFNMLSAPPVRYVMGVERVYTKDTLVDGARVTHYYHQIRLKAIENGVVRDSRSFTAADPQYLATMLDRRGNGGGLKNVKDVISCRLSSEVSGMPSFTHSFAWDGKRLRELPRTINVVDGDALWYTEKLILPNDKGGSPATITWLMEQGQMTGKKDKKGQPVYKTDSKMKKYPWNG